MKKNIIRLVINTLIGGALIFLWSRFVPLDEVYQKLQQTNLWTIVYATIILTFGGVLRGVRLWVLLPKGELNLKNSIFITLLSQFLSFVIPLRLGEFTKGLYLSTQSKHISFPKAVFWIFLDRFIDFWTVIVLACVLILLLPITVPQSLQQTVIILTILMTAGLLLAIYWKSLVKKILDLCLKMIPLIKIRTLCARFAQFIIECLDLFPTEPIKQLSVLGLTIGSWMLEGIVLYMLLSEVGITGLSFPMVLLGTLLLVLSFLIPSAPGYVGTLQVSGVVIFSYLLGYDQVSSAAAAVLFNIVMLLGSLIPGIVSIYILDVNLRNLWTKLKRKDS